MSRGIVINKATFQRAYKVIQNKFNALRAVGFPQEITDMSLPGFGMGVIPPLAADMPNQIACVMSLDSAVPLYLTEYMPGESTFPLPGNLLPVKSNKVAKPTNVAMHHTESSSKSLTDPVRVSKQVIAMDAIKQPPQPLAKVVIHEESEMDDLAMTNAILATLKGNSLQAKATETISPNVTKITLEDVLGDRRIRIPEYVMVRRKS